MRRYEINGPEDRLDPIRHDWVMEHLAPEQYRIYDTGFLISNYVIEFVDPSAETMYLLRWA